MVDTKPGKLIKQGPIATLEGGLSFSDNDRFLFNGDQFVHYVAKTPKVLEASTNSLLAYTSGSWEINSNVEFKAPSGEFRLIDGDPTFGSGTYTGIPSGDYDHIIIGYQSAVTTSIIKFWTEEYIPVEYIRVDYAYDSSSFINVPTHAGNITFTYDDALKVYESEDSPNGQYVYTIDLGSEFTAKFWRIRSFIYSLSVESVSAPVLNKDVDVTTTSGLPSSVATVGNFYLYSNDVNTSTTNVTVSYGDVEESGDSFIVRDVVINDGRIGTIKAGSFIRVYRDNGWSSWLVSSAHLVQDVEKTLGNQTLDLYLDERLDDVGELDTAYGRFYYDGAAKTPLKYASLSGNTIETINPTYFASGDVLYPGCPFVYTYPMKATQVQIQERVGPQLRYWESDGGISVANIVSISDIYDVVYDNSDDVYYVVRFNEGGGQGNPTISDYFSSGVGQYFDTNRWDLYGTSFTRDISTNCLSFLTTSGVDYSGVLSSTAYFTDSFTADLNTVVTTFSGTGSFGFSLMDHIYGNQVAGIYNVGNWGATVDRSVVAVSTSDYVNSTDGVVTLADTLFNPYNTLEGINKHIFTYVTSSGWYYSRENKTNPGENEVDLVFSSASSYINEGGFSCSLEDSSATVPNGGYVSFLTQKSTVSGINDHEVTLKAVYAEPTKAVEFLYNDGTDTSILQTSFESSVVSSNFKVGIVGKNDNFTTVSATSLNTTGDLEWRLSCFEVLAMDVEGDRVFVDGVSSANGSVISTLDVIEDPSKVYGDYYNTVSIATTNVGESGGGSLFIRVGDNIYKYNKTTLPLSSPENGTNSVVLSSGVSMQEDIKHFQFDDYSVGGLSYFYEDSNRGGVYLSVIDAGTLATTSYEAEIDVQSNVSPIARDVSDTSVLYTVVDGDVYTYNASESYASFCNVVSNTTILPASSSYSTTITAIVTNMFGVPLPNKTVTFAVTTGGGSLSSASACTSSSGTASTVFTASSIVGTSFVTATASNDVC